MIGICLLFLVAVVPVTAIFLILRKVTVKRFLSFLVPLMAAAYFLDYFLVANTQINIDAFLLSMFVAFYLPVQGVVYFISIVAGAITIARRKKRACNN